MKSRIVLIALLLSISSPGDAALPEPKTETDRIQTAYGQISLSFEANHGQTDSKVKYFSRGKGYTLFLTSNEAVLSLQKGERAENPNIENPPALLRMRLSGASQTPAVSGEEALPGRQNYFIGNDPKNWRTDIPTYQRVKYQDVYPGIDLVYYGNQRQLEYDFIVDPGIDPKKIELRFEGADGMEIDPQGNLVLTVQGEKIRMHKPVIYQEQAGQRRFIPGHYLLKGKGKVGFHVAAYDRTKPLIIDPVLSYATFLGGSDHDRGNGIAVDSSGNAYITGSTRSLDFPTVGTFDSTLGGPVDAFVAKLNPSGTALLYSTYLGGTGSDKGSAIAVDTSGNAYVTGETDSLEFPTTTGAFDRTLNGTDAFVVKLNSSGTALLNATFVGGSSFDVGNSIAIDASGQAYVTGLTYSADFPTSPGAFDTTFNWSSFKDEASDVFVVKLNPGATSLLYSTFLGGMRNDSGHDIAVDASGNAHITGSTTSPNFPTTAGAFDTTFADGGDAFAAKLNSSGSTLLYATYLGGSDLDNGRSIALDRIGSAYITGDTASSDFPTTLGAYDRSNPNSPPSGDGCESGCLGRFSIIDAFVTKLNPTGSALVYSTYLGDSESSNFGNGIAVDAFGNAYVTGRDEFSDPSNTLMSVFVRKLNTTGSAPIDTLSLARSEQESGNAIAVDALGRAYITGGTTSFDFPTTPGTFDPTPNGFSDAFVAKVIFPSSTFTDNFDRPASTNLGASWNEVLPDLELSNNQVRNVTPNNKAAIFRQAVGPDHSVSVDCMVTAPGNSCGVVARWSSESNFYRARIDAGQGNIALFKTVNGTTTALGSASYPLRLNTYYRLRLVVSGTSLAVFVANHTNPIITISDGALSFGDFAGIRSYATAANTTWFDNFNLSTPLSDTFSRSDSSSLGSNWSEYMPNLEIFSGQLRNVDAGNKAALFLQPVGPDQNVAVHCKVTAANNACGVMARWLNANNFYRLRLDAGQQNIALFKTVNGATTQIGVANRPMQLNTYYRLRLIAKGNSLAVFFNDETSPAFTASDSALTAGDFAGIRSSASAAFTTGYDNFSAGVARDAFGSASGGAFTKAAGAPETLSAVEGEDAAETAGGCAMNVGGKFDPTLIGLLGAAVIYLGWKRIKRRRAVPADRSAK
ncbi:MAG: SBBP repeat-containing protein [Candidatus Manganitrophus sp. SB1]|nr:SBBP repeat-containing protein [Candidatus Manganitrophus morganii]